MHTQEEFDAAYERLSQQWKCSVVGDAEYRRISAEWNAVGRPGGIEQFIVIRANVGPFGESLATLN